MTPGPTHARLLNSGGELVAEGVCWLDEPAGHATLEVERTPGQIQRQRGHLSLELDSGRSLLVSDKPMVVMINPTGQRPATEGRRRLYRLRLVHPMAELAGPGAANEAQEAPRSIAVDAVGGQDAPRSIWPVGEIAEDAQEADAVDAVGEGQPTASILGRLPDRGETSAAR